MKLTKYNKYKNTNIHWLGDIPEHWELKRNKSIFFEVSNLSKTGTETLLTVSHITGVTPRSEKNVNMFLAETMEGYKICKNGDLIINTMWAWMGALGTSKYEGICSPAYNIYRGRKWVNIDPRFFDYLYRTPMFIKEMTRYSKGIVESRLRLYPKDFFQINTGLPPLTEQTAIANYLDQKTAQIDKKVDLLSQKIEKYKELKKSLINETVCRGLDKNVKLKPSGIDWIGDIPEHWEVKRFKEVCYKNTTGGTPKTSNEQHFLGENTWVTIRDVEDGKFIGDSKLKLTDEAVKEANISLTPKGSLIYSFKLSVGKIAFATKDLYTNEALISILPNKYIDLEYHYFMLPIFLLLNATENIYGAKMLNQKLINNAVLLHPPLQEQTTIAHYLDEKTSKIDQITANLSQQIEALKELRKTLINEVVTGKLKVVDN